LTGLALATALLVLKSFPKLPRGRLRANSYTEGRLRRQQASRAYAALAAIGVYFVANAGIWSFVERIGRTNDLDTASIGHVLSLASFVSIGAAMLAANLGNRIGRMLPIVVSLGSLAVISVSLVTFSTLLSYALGVVLFLCFAIFFLSYALSFLESVDVTGRASIASGGVIMLGNAIGPFLGGAILSAAGLKALGYSVVLGFAIAGSLFLLACRAGKGLAQDERLAE
jgi:predicted MFS family arabinose efflux permease